MGGDRVFPVELYPSGTERIQQEVTREEGVSKYWKPRNVPNKRVLPGTTGNYSKDYFGIVKLILI